MTRRPIAFVAPGRCLEEQPFAPGEVLRVPQLDEAGRARALGYHLACPACGAHTIELCDGRTAFAEGSPTRTTARVICSDRVEREVAYWAPSSLVTSGAPIVCARCHASYEAGGSDFVVR